MAKARMLHNKISKSLQVDSLPLQAQLLFTWMISWADDEGRLKGEPKYIKGTVIPYKNWSEKLVKDYLNKMKDVSLIYYWQQNEEWLIEFIKWSDYQHLRKDRLEPSKLPSFNARDDNRLSTKTRQNDNQETTKEQPIDNQQTPQSNVIESNPREVNKGEYKEKRVTDNNSFKKVGDLVNPDTYKPNSAVETAAYEAWRKLELHNPRAFYTTYIPAAKKGLPAGMFFQFTSEIRQDPSIKNRGAVFNEKVKEFFEKNGANF